MARREQVCQALVADSEAFELEARGVTEHVGGRQVRERCVEADETAFDGQRVKGSLDRLEQIRDQRPPHAILHDESDDLDPAQQRRASERLDPALAGRRRRPETRELEHRGSREHGGGFVPRRGDRRQTLEPDRGAQPEVLEPTEVRRLDERAQAPRIHLATAALEPLPAPKDSMREERVPDLVARDVVVAALAGRAPVEAHVLEDCQAQRVLRRVIRRERGELALHPDQLPVIAFIGEPVRWRTSSGE
jgi:hypothetical protein